MKSPRVVFVCQECGAQSPKWMGKCVECGAWNSLVEERASDPATTTSANNRYAQVGAAGSAKSCTTPTPAPWRSQFSCTETEFEVSVAGPAPMTERVER